MVLSEEQMQEIEACEFAMHLLIPTDRLIDFVGDINRIENMSFMERYVLVDIISKEFNAPKMAVRIKLDVILAQEKIKKKVRVNKDNIL